MKRSKKGREQRKVKRAGKRSMQCDLEANSCSMQSKCCVKAIFEREGSYRMLKLPCFFVQSLSRRRCANLVCAKGAAT